MTADTQASPPDAYVSMKQVAAYRAFEDLIVIALETGNVGEARHRYAQAQDVLNEQFLGDLRAIALEGYSVVLG